MAIAENKSERIEVRTTSTLKALLQRAAASSHKNVTEFLLEAGINAAEDALVDRPIFRLDDRQWQPPPPPPTLQHIRSSLLWATRTRRSSRE